jgi:glycosyltransferase involved in cell wall biosynthesis
MARVDIIIPTYNRATVLPETLKSVQAQTFTDWRCFIAEDGETAATREAVAPFLQDDRFTYLPGQHAGLPAAPRNRAIRQGRAPFIAFLDDDDLWLPEKLETQMHFMEQRPVCVLLGSDAYHWNGKTAIDSGLPRYRQPPFAGKAPFESLVAINLIINSTAVVRRSVLSRSGLFNEAAALASCEEYELWLRIAPLGEVWISDKVLAAYRDAPQSSIRAGISEQTIHQKLSCVYDAAVRGDGTVPSPLTYPENKQLAFLCRKQKVWAKKQEIKLRILAAFKKLAQQSKLFLLSAGRLLGWLISFFIKKNNFPGTAVFMILSSPYNRDAEGVLSNIIACLQNYRPWVFIVAKSNSPESKKTFSHGTPLRDISFLCSNRIMCLILIGCVAEMINRAADATVFGYNARFFYEVLPLVSKNVKRVDLMPACESGIEKYFLSCIRLLDARVVTSKRTAQELAELYAANSIDPVYASRIKVIENTAVPPEDLNAHSCTQKKAVASENFCREYVKLLCETKQS